MSTTTTMRDRGDRYGPMEWAQQRNVTTNSVIKRADRLRSQCVLDPDKCTDTFARCGQHSKNHSFIIIVWLGPFYGAIAVPSVTRCRCCGHRCAGGVRQLVATPGEWQCKIRRHAAARSGEWAQHFSNASCYKNTAGKWSIDAITSTFLYVRADGINVVVGHFKDVAESVEYYLNYLRVSGRQQVAHWSNYSQTHGIHHLYTDMSTTDSQTYFIFLKICMTEYNYKPQYNQICVKSIIKLKPTNEQHGL